MQNRKVTIFQYRLFHYRVPLFEQMNAIAEEHNIDLHVVCGQPSATDRKLKDGGTLSWAEQVKNWYLPVKEKKDLCWQPTPPHLKDSDLVIVMQENRLLSNYIWILKRRFGGPRVGYWGHGRDFQTNAPGGFREKWKRAFIKQVDWWFAYNALTLDVLRDAGFPEERTTCLNNAIDTNGLRRDAESVPDGVLTAIRQRCGLKRGAPMGLFCGSLYPDKKLDLLVSAADLIHNKLPEFRLVVIGDGSSAVEIAKAFKTRPWAHWVGVKRGQEKAAYFRLAKIVLNPGLVGLHVLDAFTMGLPMVSTLKAKHSPEVVYLENGVNGFLTEDNVEVYANAALRLLHDPEFYARISTAARQASLQYSVENMAKNFMNGIEHCLDSPGYV